ncbi:MAG: hypothetical protein ABJC61_13590 [Acidobacteriota bacterium]
MLGFRKIGAISTLLLGMAGCAGTASSPRPAAPGGKPQADTPAQTVAPEALAGYWLFEMKAGGRSIEASLHFRSERGVLAGTFTGPDGNERELSDLALKENGVSWNFEGPLGRQHADGKIDGGSMRGTMKRAARARRAQGSSGSDDEPDPQEPPRGSGGGAGGSRGGGGRGGGGRGGRRGSSSGAGEVTWSAYKSALPPSETPAPVRTPV